jgi:AcrR family transcriptional regulator
VARRYRSRIRDEQASRTRAALLEACEALLLEVPVEEVTLPAVARRAGVTKPTAYNNFPDNDALLLGFLDHVRDRVGMDHETLASLPRAELPAAIRENYRRYERNAEVLRKVMDSPSYNRVRLSRKIDRAGMTMPNWRGLAPERVLRQRLGPIYMLVTPAIWRWLRETWGLSGEEAASAAAWAAEALVVTLEESNGRRRSKTKSEPLRKQAKEKRK